jgi:hypothetical protein
VTQAPPPASPATIVGDLLPSSTEDRATERGKPISGIRSILPDLLGTECAIPLPPMSDLGDFPVDVSSSSAVASCP